ncbi:hypothetical protein [Clostridium tagluense]|uniref:hypothetical protein n=1 Tax=Clostridium tagluense TaxID=360422 RepID=UPI001CF45D00|nr:hypothetical protein [Clostridium tagluense]MCB2300122.1 hypothetical protein [Clostridium tagluense]
MINEEINNRLKNLFVLHNDVAEKCITAYDGAFYALDLLALSVINRSYNLLDGFIELINKKNIIAAAPLIRMQLDNVLRFSAAFYVEDPHSFSLKVLEGIPIRNIDSIENKKMTDRYLVEKLVKTQQKKWIKKVYNNTSGYVHFSEKHIYSTFQLNKNKNGEFNVFIGPIGKNTKDPLLLEAIECFIECTKMLMTYIEGWIFTKDNPEKVQEIRKNIINKTGKEPEIIFSDITQ